jgi:hypothetical protein
MPLCPRCASPVKATDLTCGTCQLMLKAHGHPGIDLHRSTGEVTLCSDCAYHADDSCTFPQRPYAKTCTLYQSMTAPAAIATSPVPTPGLRRFWQRYRTGLILLGILGLSLWLALS